ncbi:MAG: hypothetical protein EBZ78_02575 [Verrucomicrobia bacterium]|nr:hypothetical protein [Verrucomicrobiota bacterium]
MVGVFVYLVGTSTATGAGEQPASTAQRRISLMAIRGLCRGWFCTMNEAKRYLHYLKLKEKSIQKTQPNLYSVQRVACHSSHLLDLLMQGLFLLHQKLMIHL